MVGTSSTEIKKLHNKIDDMNRIYDKNRMVLRTYRCYSLFFILV